MPVTTAKIGPSARFRQSALLALLIGSALPALAATGIGSDCDAAPKDASANALSEAAAAVASTTMNATITIDSTLKRSAPLESFRLRQADTAATKHKASSDLGNLLPRAISAPVTPSSELRSAALADALERRQQRRSALGSDVAAETTGPRVEAGIPGVSEEEALVFRREMFRTDI